MQCCVPRQTESSSKDPSRGHQGMLGDDLQVLLLGQPGRRWCAPRLLLHVVETARADCELKGGKEEERLSKF